MPPTNYAFTSGIAIAVGVLGAVCAGAPLRLLVDGFGWRGVMWVVAAVTAFAAVATWMMVRDDPAERGFKSHFEGSHGTAHHTRLLDDLREILRNRNVVLLFFIPGAACSMVLTFAGLWGVPFLVTHYQLAPAAAAGVRGGDVIVKVGKFAVRNESDLSVALIQNGPGTKLNIEVYRDGKKLTLEVTLGTPQQ